MLIIQRSNRSVGAFSDYIVFLPVIEKAIREGLIPIIDRKTIQNIFCSGYPDVNTWEFFFEQPCHVGLEDLKSGEYNVLSCDAVNLGPVMLSKCKDPLAINYWRSFARKYIRFNAETKAKLNDFRKILGSGRVLGVRVREGYSKLAENNPELVRGHPKQLSINDLIGKTIEKIEQWNCDNIFLVCQTTETIELFRKEFGSRLICSPFVRTPYADLYDYEVDVEARLKQTDRKRREFEYICEMYLLSRCTLVMCTSTSGVEAAYIMGEHFENFEVIDLGTY